MIPDLALFAAGEAIGFPPLQIRTAVYVVTGIIGWERFTTNGTDEDLAAARVTVAAALAEKAHRRHMCAFRQAADAVGANQPREAQPRSACTFCGASLAARRPHSRYCSGRCRAADSRARRAARSVVAR